MKKLTIGAILFAIAGSVFAISGFITHDHSHESEVVQHHEGIDQCGGHHHEDYKDGEYHYHRTPNC